MSRTRDHLLIALGFIALLYVGKALFIPLAYSLLLALVMYPMVARMERRGISRSLAISAGLLVVVLLFSAIVVLLVWQMNAFMDELPALREKSTGIVAHAMDVVQRYITDLGDTDNYHWESILAMLPTGLAEAVIPAMNAVFGMVFNLFIIPIIAALLLLHRGRYVMALTVFVGPALRAVLPDVLERSVRNFSKFITGTAKVYVIVGVLNSIGLLLLGVDNAIFFGMLSALMTIIPYVGIIISSLLPMSVVWVATGSILYPAGVVFVYGLVQYVEANLIFPKIVGRQLNLNTLASIVIVLAGALLWGVSGMILLLPYVAILKIISSDIPSLRGINLLLGDDDLSGSDNVVLPNKEPDQG
ncbi:MAG: AI-2E family transporter [Flavobacteriales bacterium]